MMTIEKAVSVAAVTVAQGLQMDVLKVETEAITNSDVYTVNLHTIEMPCEHEVTVAKDTVLTVGHVVDDLLAKSINFTHYDFYDELPLHALPSYVTSNEEYEREAKKAFADGEKAANILMHLFGTDDSDYCEEVVKALVPNYPYFN